MKLFQTPFARRALIAGLLAGSGVLAASAFANSGDGPVTRPGCESRKGQMAQDYRGERRAAHLATLKEKLKLQPEQEAAWTAFANRAQAAMESKGPQRQGWREDLAKLSTPERLDKMLAFSDMRRAKMVERAESIKALYVQLTPEQQRIFDAEAMPKRRAGHRHFHGPHHLSHQS